jgi:hypothetical protein
VSLLVATVVVLAAVLGTLAFGFESRLREPAPTGGFDTQWVADDRNNADDRPYVVFTHEVRRTVDADNIVIEGGSGNTIRWSELWTGGPEVRAGEYVHIDGFDSDGALDPICEASQRYWVLVIDDRGHTLVVKERTVPTDPSLPAGSPSDSDGDGRPGWC